MGQRDVQEIANEIQWCYTSFPVGIRLETPVWIVDPSKELRPDIFLTLFTFLPFYSIIISIWIFSRSFFSKTIMLYILSILFQYSLQMIVNHK